VNRVRLMLARILFTVINDAIAMGANGRVVSRLAQAFALLLRPLIESGRGSPARQGTPSGAGPRSVEH
jgi:hypothetical protein